MKKNAFLFILIFAVSMMMFSSSARATSVLPTNFVDIVDRSQFGFQGVVKSVSNEQSQFGPAEKITVEISEVITGIADDQKIISWLQFKGSERFRLPSMPAFSEGQEVIVFLSGKAEGSELQAPMSLDQGVFKITKDAESGKSYGTNSLNNSALLKDLDVEKMSSAIADQKSAGKSMTGDEKAKEKLKASKQVKSLQSRAIEVSNIINLAKEIKKMDQPSKALKSEGGKGGKNSKAILTPVNLFPDSE